jgi:hypothetical protein
MSTRIVAVLSTLGLSCMLFAGCGGESGDLGQGTPEAVDLSKPVKPEASLTPIAPGGSTSAGVPVAP